jgi:hypothetical protein
MLPLLPKNTRPLGGPRLTPSLVTLQVIPQPPLTGGEFIKLNTQTPGNFLLLIKVDDAFKVYGEGSW